MSERAPRVLILDLSLNPTIYRPTAHWQALLGVTPSESASPVRGEPLPSPAGFTHLIVTGSEATIVEPQAWFEPAQQLIRRAVAARLSVLGSCFGHQLIVRTLHGPAHVRRAETPELGWLPIQVAATDPASVGAAGEAHWMFCCHFDEVCDLPKEYRILAHTPDCGVHAYRLGDAPVWGLQAHPEILPEEGATLLRAFAQQRPDIANAVDQALAQPSRDDGFGEVLTRRFLGWV